MMGERERRIESAARELLAALDGLGVGWCVDERRALSDALGAGSAPVRCTWCNDTGHVISVRPSGSLGSGPCERCNGGGQ